MRRCGTALIPENDVRFHKPPLKALTVPDQNTRIIIPVVFHVVGNSSIQNLLTDERINQQIKQIRQDFVATNSDITKVPSAFELLIGNSARISFELKQTIRKTTSTASFKANLNNQCSDPIKLTSLGGSDAIETDKNLNIWAGNIYQVEPYDLLGYAMFPWTRLQGSCNASVDGVVAHFETIGSVSLPNPGSLAPFFNLGRTLTHEVGHYLGFKHMWNDCSETTCCRSLPDLPAQKGPNYEKPTFPHRANTCPSGAESPPQQYGDMFMNYMDYVDDDTMVMFSESQLSLAMEMCLQYRPNMVRQFKSTSTSALNLSGLTRFRNDDIYKCVVTNENESVILETDSVRVITD